MPKKKRGNETERRKPQRDLSKINLSLDLLRDSNLDPILEGLTHKQNAIVERAMELVEEPIDSDLDLYNHWGDLVQVKKKLMNSPLPINNQKRQTLEKLENKQKKVLKVHAKQYTKRARTLAEEGKFLEAKSELQKTINMAQKFGHEKTIADLTKQLNFIKRIQIRETILRLGSQFHRLMISEIAEDCGACDEDDEALIVSIVKEMINEKEIYAKYFKTTNAVSFNQQANLEVMENLDEQFESWVEHEHTKQGKMENFR